MFGFVGGMTAKQGREPILILGFVTAAVAYFLMLLNLPAASAIRETLPGETGLMTPNSIIVLVTGFGLGFSDACFMTQVSQTYIIKVKEQHALDIRHSCWIVWRQLVGCIWNIQIFSIPGRLYCSNLWRIFRTPVATSYRRLLWNYWYSGVCKIGNGF